MGHLSFFTAAYVGGGAIASTFGGEDTSAMSSLVARPQQERQQQRRRRPVINSASSKAVSSIFVAALLLCMLAFAAAQDEPKCNCSPVGYTFELKLDAYTCPDPNDSIRPDDAVAYFGPGVKAYTCNPKSQIPVTINEAQFIVSDETNNPVLTQTKDSLELTDGETLTFTSVTTNPPLVGFILLKLVGEDINGVVIESRWTIQFTNECGVLSLEDGTEFSLVIFVSLFVLTKTDVLVLTMTNNYSPHAAVAQLMIERSSATLENTMSQRRSSTATGWLLLLPQSFLEGGQGKQTHKAF